MGGIEAFAGDARSHAGILPGGEGGFDLNGPRIAGSREKPQQECTVRMGVYVPSQRVLDRNVPGLPDELPAAFLFDGFWLDIGRPDGDGLANLEFPLRTPTLIGWP